VQPFVDSAAFARAMRTRMHCTPSAITDAMLDQVGLRPFASHSRAHVHVERPRLRAILAVLTAPHTVCAQMRRLAVRAALSDARRRRWRHRSR
jgi:hypothetical protein